MTEEHKPKKAKKKSSHKTTQKSPKHETKCKADPTMPWKVVCAILAILLIIAIFTGGFSFKASEDDTETEPKDPVVTGDALVLIEEYSDFECPYCAKFYKETYLKVKEEYGSNVKFEFNHFPLSFHQNAQKASEASECARDQGKFEEMHDVLFENNNKLSVSNLKSFAEDLGLNMETFNTCLDNGDKEAIVKADMAEGQQRGVSGTPAFFINGEMLVGAQPFSAVKQVIDKALANAGEDVVVKEDPKVQMTILNDPSCSYCDSSRIEEVTKSQIFPTAEITKLDINSEEGKALAEELSLDAIPAYIFGSEITEASNFDQVANVLFQVGDKYMIDPSALDNVKLLNPPEIKEGEVILGNADAPITIIEYSDFECPFCAKFYTESHHKIEEAFLTTGKAKMVFRHFPLSFHANAQKAAEAIECAKDQDNFWAMHDKLFENSDTLGVDAIKGYAVDLGLDAVAFGDCLDTDKYADKVANDMSEGSALGISGTPGFLINGIKVSGALPFEEFQKIINAELGN
jgi:protein-disulfide isomerase